MIQACKNGHFNFPKWHVILYYQVMIKCYESATNFTTGIKKTIYIIWIKDLFKQTNMRKGYKRQILDNNIDKFNFIVRDDINMFSSYKIVIQGNKIAKL